MAVKWFPRPLVRNNTIIYGFHHKYETAFFFCFRNYCHFLWIWLRSLKIYKTIVIYFQCRTIYYRFCTPSICGIMKLFSFSLHSRRIINLSPVMLISEEQPAQPALPVQPEGTRVVCGHCGNTFLVGNQTFVIVASVCTCRCDHIVLTTAQALLVLSKSKLIRRLKESPFKKDS